MTASAGTTGRATSERPASWLARSYDVVILAVLAYVPLLLTQRGQVGADTKTYLYLDPSRLLREAPYLWDSGTGAGTVTHQNIGYLWPLGPFYWVMEQVGLPDWAAQRIWLATILFAAGMGVRYLLRTLGWRGSGVLVASLAYMLSPYLLDYEARISVILLPWAALPWVVAFTARALRQGGWRYPALLALVLLTAGGTNATALLMIAPAAVLWIGWAIWIEREVTVRQSLAALGRIVLLTFVTSLWWLAGLWAQGRYGMPVLRYTESYRTVAEASLSQEVLRGFGYWFFYGRDKLGPWIQPNVEYTNRVIVLAISFLIPTLALAGAALARWRHRAYFLSLVVVGAIISIGAHPWNASSPLGALFKLFTRTDAGLALRSTPRAGPMVVLGLAVGLGAGVTAVQERLPRLTVPVTALAGVLIVLNLPPLWNGTMVADNLKRDEALPEYWLDAAQYLDSRDDGTRMLEIPGSDFASYRWGNTVDPVTPGLTDRPFLARELFLYGSPQSNALLIALDQRIQDGTLDPDALAPIARLFGAGDIVLRSDLQYERFRTARPRQTWSLVSEMAGLESPTEFGEATHNRAGPEQPLVDEIELGSDPDLADPPPVAVFGVEDPVGIVRAESADQPLLVGGDQEGVVDAAGAGLLRRGQPILFAASYATDREGFEDQLDRNGVLLLTDTNRKRGHRWGTLLQNPGYTERADEERPFDPTDNRLDLFPGVGDDSSTVSEQRGGVTATAGNYGNPVTFAPDDRAANAIDGDPLTAWRVGAFSDARGERLTLDLDESVTADEIRLLQPVQGVINRAITNVRLHFDDGGDPLDVQLNVASELEPGQVIPLGAERTFSHLELEIVETNLGDLDRWDGASAVGFAEISVGDLEIEELIRPPTDLLDLAGEQSIDHDLLLLFTRLRIPPTEPVGTAEEITIRRVFDLPTARSFDLTATARLDPNADSPVLDELLRVPQTGDGGITARASDHLPGSARSRASAAVDGDTSTWWSSRIERQEGKWLDLTLPEPTEVDSFQLDMVADGRHSLPRQLFVIPDGDESRLQVVDVPPVETSSKPGTTRRVDLDLEPVTASALRIVVAESEPVTSVDWHSGIHLPLPVGIAEVGIDDLAVGDPPDEFDSGCRDDLLTIDDDPVPVQIVGSTDDALDYRPLDVQVCDGAVDGIDLAEGEHILRTAPGRDVGIDIDQVLLTSGAGGEAVPAADANPGVDRNPPTLEVASGRTTADVDVTGAREPFWLVLGQSLNDGWSAEIDGVGDLGPPTLVDGYANGWLIDPAALGPDGLEDFAVHLEWGPQRVIWVALALSALGVIACLALIVVGRRRERAAPSAAGTPGGRTAWPASPEADWPGAPRWHDTEGWCATQKMAIVTAVALTLVLALNTPPPGFVALVAGVATYAAIRWRRAQSLLVGLAAVIFGLSGLSVVIEQLRYRYGPNFSWPQYFEEVHLVGLLVIFLLAGQAVRETLARRAEGVPSTMGPSDPTDPDAEARPPGRDEEHPGGTT